MANIAHITKSGKLQTLDAHLQNVSNYCAVCAEKIGLSACGKLAGMLHDLGKFNDAFAAYLHSVHENPDLHKRGPDHATAGAVYVQSLAGNCGDSIRQMTAQILSVVIVWHHGGLRDIRDFEGESPYLIRLKKFEMPEQQALYEEIVNEFHGYFSRQELERLFDEAVLEISGLLKKIKGMKTSEENTNNRSERAFSLGLVCKFLYSCLIDADRYDAFLFDEGRPMCLPVRDHEKWTVLCTRFEDKFRRLSAGGDKAINRLRTVLSDHCLQSAGLAPGIFTLNCPTGAGKTLSSLRYALHHARQYQKDRIFYIIPLISIIEQNSKVIKDFLEEENLVLELHSAVEPDFDDKGGNGELESRAKDYELLTERMDAPVVITTMVRFLNTFFKGKTRSPRAIHNFANSIIIFDEIQTIPLKCIGLFNPLINFLVYVCHATVILSTATQIALDQRHGTETPLVGVSEHEISNCTKAIREQFIRVDFDTSLLYEAESGAGRMKQRRSNSIDDITDAIKMKSLENNSILCIFNTKKSTESVYDAICQMQEEGRLDSDIDLYFLTTALCPAHRFAIIDQIKRDLAAGKRMIVVSTQLIEAGVDVSFDIVFRALAGLDSIIQSAGRCNREGDHKHRGRIVLLDPDFEDLSRLEAISKGKRSTLMLMQAFERDPSRFDGRYDSQAAIEAYFRSYLECESEYFKYPFQPTGQTSKVYMYDLLAGSDRPKSIKTILTQMFETAGMHFTPIDTGGIPVAVPYAEGKTLIADALSLAGLEKKRELLRKLQQYMVNIMGFREREIDEYAVFYEALGIYILKEGHYDDIKGFIREQHFDTLMI